MYIERERNGEKNDRIRTSPSSIDVPKSYEDQSCAFVALKGGVFVDFSQNSIVLSAHEVE